MKHDHLDKMVKGWFVGAFTPTIHATDACEVAIKRYKAGDLEAAHYHKIATEITVIVYGHVRMCGREWRDGDIISLAPGEVTDFEVLADTLSVVVKVPGARDDKYLAT